MGTVTYNVYSDAACTHAVSTGTAELMTAPGTLPASSPVTLATPGIYYWQATYSGDGLNGTSVSTCGLTGEVETVTPKAPVFNSPATATFVKSKHGTFTVHATGYPTTMTFAKTGTLPGGVTLTTTGVLSGTSMVTGTFRFTITASNGVLPNTTQSFTLKVVAIEITTTSLLKATHGVSYSTALEELGGKSPFKWTATGLPSGLSLAAATGTLSGKANRASVYRVKVTLTDSTTPTKNKATATLTLTVK
jgi:hypothetical protein